MKRIPTHPGVILLRDFIMPNKLTQTKLSKMMRAPMQRINEIVKGKRRMTLVTALQLEDVFEASAEFWLNLQTAYDCWVARERKRGTE